MEACMTLKIMIEYWPSVEEIEQFCREEVSLCIFFSVIIILSF